MPKPSCGEVEVQPDLARHVVEHVGYQARVDERQRDRAQHHAPDRPEAAEDDHGQHEDRERELELVGVDRVVEGAEERAGHAAHRRAERVGEELHAHGRDAHADRGDLVLADRDPRPADARVAQPEVDEQHDQRERERRPVPRSEVQRGEAVDEREVDLVDRRDAGAAVREVEVADAEDALVGVDRDAADDLAERERHDRDVVAAQAQRREAEQRAQQRRDDRGDRQDDQPVEVDARLALRAARRRRCGCSAPENQLEPNQPIVYAPIAKNAT